MPKILLVEDDEDLSGTLAAWLEFHNYMVDTAATGADALVKMCHAAYDVILLDWNLPDMPGLDVCRQYRMAAGNDRLLMLTGNESGRQTALQAGADDLLPKTVDLEQLIVRLTEFLQKPLARLEGKEP